NEAAAAVLPHALQKQQAQQRVAVHDTKCNKQRHTGCASAKQQQQHQQQPQALQQRHQRGFRLSTRCVHSSERKAAMQLAAQHRQAISKTTEKRLGGDLQHQPPCPTTAALEPSRRTIVRGRAHVLVSSSTRHRERGQEYRQAAAPGVPRPACWICT
ncbi:hypothetical protein COO60DRAFT_598595, partial [Scenedesmus sp. NREL 46B-D3]